METLQSLKKVLNSVKRNKRIVFVTGTFDILHVGHIHFFKKAKLHGDILVVGLASDKQVQRVKGTHRPVIHEKQRLEMVRSIRYVDYAFITKDVKKSEMIRELNPHVVFYNMSKLDTETERKRSASIRKLSSLLPDIKFISMKSKNPASTSSIIDKIKTL